MVDMSKKECALEEAWGGGRGGGGQKDEEVPGWEAPFTR